MPLNPTERVRKPDRAAVGLASMFDEEKFLRAAKRALAGQVTPRLRAVSVDISVATREILARFIFDREPSDSEIEEGMTSILENCPAGWMITQELKVCRAGKKMNQLRFVLYPRPEDSSANIANKERGTETLLEEINRHALFHEMHRSIEEAATNVVKNIMAGKPDRGMSYPPNCGLSLDEIEALRSIPKTPAMRRALRKVIADATSYPLFHLMCLADGVAEAPNLRDVKKRERQDIELMLHDGFYSSYWAWRRRRPNPGWRLDTYEGKAPS